MDGAVKWLLKITFTSQIANVKSDQRIFISSEMQLLQPLTNFENLAAGVLREKKFHDIEICHEVKQAK